MLVDSTGAFLYTVFNGATSIVYQFDLSAANTLGSIANKYANGNVGANTIKSIPHLTADDATLYVPYVKEATPQLSVFIHATADLASADDFTISIQGVTANVIDISSASITAMDTVDASPLFHIILAGDVFIYMAI